MKILVITNGYPPYAKGGAEIVAKTVAEGLEQYGDDVVVLSTHPFSGLMSLFLSKEDNIYRFFPLNFYHYLNDYKHPTWLRLLWHGLDMFNLHSFFAVMRVLNKEKPEIVLTHNLKGLGYLTLLACKVKGVKVFHTVHDVQLSLPSGLLIKGEENSYLNTFWATKLYERINKFLFSFADIVFSPSKYLLNFYKEKGFFKKSLNKILRNPITFTGSKKNFVGKWTELNFVYLGQLESHKGVSFLLEAFEEYLSTLEDYLDYKLHIIGGGSLEAILKKKYKDNPQIVFHGKVLHSEVIDLLSEMDFMIFSSMCYENSPASIGESLAIGVPVICADIGGSAELIKEGHNGYRFKAGDRDSLLKALETATSTLEDFDKIKENCKNSIKTYRMQNYIRKIEKLIQRQK